jgi:small subunit ribosomal protein S3
MESGALGCEVVLSGKLTGARSRVQKFTEGYIKHAGEPSITMVEKGYAVAIKKLGTIGVQVKIILPETKLPDKFEILDVAPKHAPIEEPVEEDLGATIDAELAATPDEEYVAEEVR